ncbi:MAG: DASH family cryptochrome [Deltaproteobacteria bacterium]|nr:MAG: DASH family cryptochrome [Deltaproteobacteria bacterium]
MSKAIVWFKTDLRLHDHAPLTQALEEHDQVLGVYCLNPSDFAPTRWGWPKTGPHRARFLLESLEALSQECQTRDGKLVVLWGAPEQELPALATKMGASAVYAHAEIAHDEKKQEAAVKAALSIPFLTNEGNQLYPSEELPFTAQDIPDIFTQFRKGVEKYSAVAAPLPKPAKIPYWDDDVPAFSLPTLGGLGLKAPEVDDRQVLPFEGGEQAGLNRLDAYLWETDCIASYKKTRNKLLGANYSSKFSPWLALGCLSPRTIYAKIQHYEEERVANSSTYWLFFELLWREYFRWVMQKYDNQFFLPGGIKGTRPYHRPNPELFEQWQYGFTGMPFVDANMRELHQTGFMSNRGRQNVASFLVKDLCLDWRKGASYFESMLLDYDVCSNWGNWAYVAGVGNDPREQRYFNVLLQAQRYDAKGRYVRQWIPELAPLPDTLIHTPFALSSSQQERFGLQVGKEYPRLAQIPQAWRKLM